jgi:hypothetical protein
MVACRSDAARIARVGFEPTTAIGHTQLLILRYAQYARNAQRARRRCTAGIRKTFMATVSDLDHEIAQNEG